MESLEASSTKKAVAFQAYSSLIKDFQDLDNSWSFPLILGGEWQHGQGTALPWGTGDVLLSQSCEMSVPSPLLIPGPLSWLQVRLRLVQEQKFLLQLLPYLPAPFLC